MWSKDEGIKNKRVFVNCDNIAVVHMINNMSSSCKNCMQLLQKIIKDTLVNNYHVFALYVCSEDNDIADALSRSQFNRFWNICKKQNKTMDRTPSIIPADIWPPEDFWIK